MMIYIRWCCQGAGMALVFLLGALFGPHTLPESAVAAQKRAVPPKVIQAQAFQVVDAHGVVRGAFRMKDDHPILSLYDQKQQSRIDLWLCDEDPVLQMFDHDGIARIALCVSKAGSLIGCYDGKYHPRVEIGVLPFGTESAFIKLRDENQNCAFSLDQSEFSNEITCFGRDGHMKAELRVQHNLPSFTFFNHTSQPSLQLLGGTPFTGLALYQPDKQRRAWYGLEQGIPSFGLQDAAGARRLEGALTPEGARLRALDEKGAVTGAWPGK